MLTSDLVPQTSDQAMQVLVQNNSQESRTFRAQLWTLHTQVLLLHPVSFQNGSGPELDASGVSMVTGWSGLTLMVHQTS